MIVSIIVIALLSAGTLFAGKNNTASSNSNKYTELTSTANNSSAILITINDMNNKVVYSETISGMENYDNIKLNPINKLAKGTYNITVVADNRKMTQKLIVE